MTFLRMILIVPLGFLIWESQWLWAFWLFIGAGISDLLDGLLARKFNWESEFGGLIDPMADKILCGGIVVMLTVVGEFALWLTALIIAREITICTGYLIYKRLFGTVEMSPLLVSKVNTGALIVVIALLLAELAGIRYIEDAASVLVDPIGYIVLAGLILISGVAYVVIYGRSARAGSRVERSSE